MSKKKKQAEKKLEIVLKCDSAGSLEALRASIEALPVQTIPIEIIHAGIGDITSSDVFLAETGSRLILGYEVSLTAKVDHLLKEHNVEVRLFSIIYRLTENIEAIAKTLAPHAALEEVIGTAKVVALFKSCRKGIILGCEVMDGHLGVGNMFRVVSAMGPVYQGRIHSLQIERNNINKAVPGQKAGVKIADFKKVHIGDFVESFRPLKPHHEKTWTPSGKVLYI